MIWLSSNIWFKLKTKYWSKKYSIKWRIFKQINYFLGKNINTPSMKVVKISKKIKKLDIIIEKIVTIKLIKNLSYLFKIYFIMLSQNIRNNNKFFNL